MKKLLVDYDCDPNIELNQNEDRLVSFCLKNSKYQACKMLLTLCKDRISLNEQNKDNTTSFGRAFYNCDESPDQEILKLMNTDYSEQIDHHKSQIKTDEGNLVTPIYWFIKYTTPKDIESMYKSKEWPLCFPYESFSLKLPEEVD